MKGAFRHYRRGRQVPSVVEGARHPEAALRVDAGCSGNSGAALQCTTGPARPPGSSTDSNSCAQPGAAGPFPATMPHCFIHMSARAESTMDVAGWWATASENRGGWPAAGLERGGRQGSDLRLVGGEAPCDPAPSQCRCAGRAAIIKGPNTFDACSSWRQDTLHKRARADQSPHSPGTGRYRPRLRKLFAIPSSLTFHCQHLCPVSCLRKSQLWRHLRGKARSLRTSSPVLLW